MNLVALSLVLTLGGCGDTETPAPTPKVSKNKGKKGKGKNKAKGKAKNVKIDGPAPALLVSQAWFKRDGGKPSPQPAKLVIWRTDGTNWGSETILDKESNVFHKAMPFRKGILTIGAMKAKLKHWTNDGGEWKAETLWERSWGGKFDRLRDVEIGDVTGDGKNNIVLATHDFGVVAVGTKKGGKWDFVEMDKKADTFVHEIEIGDVDGDGKKEFYATPSDRNKASGVSQPGGVVRYQFKGGKFVRDEVVHWEESHAKEILVADLDGDKVDELYVVREAHTEKGPDGKPKIIEPVKISRLTPAGKGAKGKGKDAKGKGKGKGKAGGGDALKEKVIYELQDRQCRFLTAGDVTGDGKIDLVAAGYKSGLWLIEKKGAKFEGMQIDARSGGFEHATHLADLDNDGKLEIYAADDKNSQQLRRYVWNGRGFDRTIVGDLGQNHITWNIQDAKL